MEANRRVSQAKLLWMLQDGGARFVAVSGSRTPIGAHVASETAYNGEFWRRPGLVTVAVLAYVPTGVRRIR